MPAMSRLTRIALPLAVLLPLAACGGSDPEPANVETDVEDISGGEMMVPDETSAEVPVDLPETPMTPVPDASASTAPAE